MNASLALAAGSLLLLVWRFWAYGRKLRNKSHLRKGWSASARAKTKYPAPCEPADSLTHVDKAKDEAQKPSREPIDTSAVNRAYRIADMHFARGDFEQAEKWFIKVLALHEFHTEALNRLGVIYIQQNNARKAELLYRKIFSVTQKEPAYYANYGRCLYAQGRLNDAVEAYENAIKLDATKAARYVSVGQISYEQKDYAKALNYFSRAFDLDPKNTDYLALIIELAELAGDTERLQRSLKKMAELNPYNETIKAKLAAIQKDSPKA